jgi:hypothetical protein
MRTIVDLGACASCGRGLPRIRLLADPPIETPRGFVLLYECICGHGWVPVSLRDVSLDPAAKAIAPGDAKP